MRVEVRWARERAEAVLRGAGLTEQQAALVADALIEAELRGRPTHGLIRLRSILERLKTMQRRPVRIEIDRGATALVDGGNELGYIVSDFCMRLVMERARLHGLALVAAHDTTHAGMLGYFVEPIARADLIGVAFTNCARTTAPAGAADAVFGTNPLAAAIPSECRGASGGSEKPEARGQRPDPQGQKSGLSLSNPQSATRSSEAPTGVRNPQLSDPILLDFSTSAATIGDLMLAMTRGEPLPAGVAVDRDGAPTTDPRKAREGALLAFGDHKGSGLALVIQVLSTAFTGATVFPPLGRDYGYVTLACDPYLFVSREAFQASVRGLISAVKSARRQPGVSEVLIPGERGFRARRAALAAGLDVDPSTLALLETA